MVPENFEQTIHEIHSQSNISYTYDIINPELLEERRPRSRKATAFGHLTIMRRIKGFRRVRVRVRVS